MKRATALLRIVVGILAVTSAALTTSAAESWHTFEVVIAYIAAFAAVALSIVPIGDWEKHHLDLFRRWSYVRRRWESFVTEITRHEAAKDLTREELATIDDLTDARIHIEVDEPAPFRKCLRKCQQEVAHSKFGKRKQIDVINEQIRANFGPDAAPPPSDSSTTQTESGNAVASV